MDLLGRTFFQCEVRTEPMGLTWDLLGNCPSIHWRKNRTIWRRFSFHDHSWKLLNVAWSSSSGKGILFQERNAWCIYHSMIQWWDNKWTILVCNSMTPVDSNGTEKNSAFSTLRFSLQSYLHDRIQMNGSWAINRTVSTISCVPWQLCRRAGR